MLLIELTYFCSWRLIKWDIGFYVLLHSNYFFSTSFYNSFTDLSADSNSPPKANAGGDHTVELPVDVLVLNGSQSWDDLAIAKWLWTREPTSLAIGSIIAGTDTSPVLMVSLCFALIWYFCYIKYKCDTCVTTHSL